MSVLAAKAYDPTTAVTKSTATLIAMTAVDTTNLRLTATVPASGRVWVQIIATVHGATTFPQILLGAMVGSTVVARAAPQAPIGGTALATTFQNVAVLIPVTGLTPGSTTFDAAYGVETAVTSSGIKYGGPDNTTTNDAFGAFIFAIHDLG